MDERVNSMKPDKDSANKNPYRTSEFRLNAWMYSRAGDVVVTVAGSLNRFGVTANGLTLFGFILSCFTGILLAIQEIQAAGLVLILAGACDILDGRLADIQGGSTSLGAFLDSTLDQLSDIVIMLGLTWYLLQNQLNLEILLVVLVVGLGLTVSYIKARVGQFGVECKIGPFGRFERTIITIFGFLIAQISILLWVLFVAVALTVVRRMRFSVIQLRRL